MPKDIKSDKSDAESLPASTPAGATATDAMPDDSSPSKSSTSSGDKSGKQTMESVVKDAFEKSTAESSSPEDSVQGETDETSEQDTGEEDAVQEQEETEQTEEKAEGEKEDAPADEKAKEQKEEEETEDKGPVPYERFEEVVRKRADLENQVQRIQPLAEAHQKIIDYCSSYGISREQFADLLEVAALLNTNPAKALERINPIVDSLQGLAGNKLPEDLQKDVDNGDITLVRAKEIAQLRAQRQFGEKYNEHQQQVAQQHAQENFQKTLANAAQSWESAKRTSDPDYRPKSKEGDADGLWEATKDKFLSLLHKQNDKGEYENPIRSPENMTALLERAYLSAKQMLRATAPKKPITRTLTRNNSSTNHKRSPAEAKSFDEAIKLAAARHGL